LLLFSLQTTLTCRLFFLRAEDWDLAKPLRTCSLLVERDDDKSCFVKLLNKADNNALFAQCIITLDSSERKVSQFVETVVDSSRYFVLRIVSSSRAANIGVGFRERDDASNFRLALQDFEQSVQRSQQADKLHEQYEENEATTRSTAVVGQSATTSIQGAMSKLTLKEGEKIHVNLGGNSTTTTSSISKTTKKTAAGGAGVPLLKKPPAPPTAASPRDSTASSVTTGSEVDSACAVGSLTSEEDWNDDEAYEEGK
jgi:hypothetical protein